MPNSHAAAADVAGQFLQAAVELPRDAYTAATLLADCALLAGQDKRLPERRRQELASTYGDAALAALGQAVAAGFADVAQMASDSNLDPLRHRDEFRKLLAGLRPTTQP
jgi:hypothetical protein